MTRKMRTLAIVLGLGLCVGLSAACSKTESSELETNQIRAEMYAEVNENDVPASAGGTSTDPTHGSFLSVSLYKSDNYFELVDLTAGDSLSVATNLNPTTPLKGGDVPGFYSSGHLDLSGLTEANFIFTRASKTSAPNSKVKVPPAFDITSPKQDDTISLSSGKVTVTWSNPVDGAKIYVYAKICKVGKAQASNTDTSVPDTGSVDVSLDQFGGMPTGPTCYLVTLERVLSGTPDPAWRSGTVVRARHSHYISFTGTP